MTNLQSGKPGANKEKSILEIAEILTNCFLVRNYSEAEKIIQQHTNKDLYQILIISIENLHKSDENSVVDFAVKFTSYLTKDYKWLFVGKLETLLSKKSFLFYKICGKKDYSVLYDKTISEDSIDWQKLKKTIKTDKSILSVMIADMVSNRDDYSLLKLNPLFISEGIFTDLILMPEFNLLLKRSLQGVLNDYKDIDYSSRVELIPELRSENLLVFKTLGFFSVDIEKEIAATIEAKFKEYLIYQVGWRLDNLIKVIKFFDVDVRKLNINLNEFYIQLVTAGIIDSGDKFPEQFSKIVEITHTNKGNFMSFFLQNVLPYVLSNYNKYNLYYKKGYVSFLQHLSIETGLPISDWEIDPNKIMTLIKSLEISELVDFNNLIKLADFLNLTGNITVDQQQVTEMVIEKLSSLREIEKKMTIFNDTLELLDKINVKLDKDSIKDRIINLIKNNFDFYSNKVKDFFILSKCLELLAFFGVSISIKEINLEIQETDTYSNYSFIISIDPTFFERVQLNSNNELHSLKSKLSFVKDLGKITEPNQVKLVIKRISSELELTKFAKQLKEYNSTEAKVAKSNYQEMVSFLGQDNADKFCMKFSINLESDFDYFNFARYFTWIRFLKGLPKNEILILLNDCNSLEDIQLFQRDLQNFDPEKVNEVRSWIRSAIDKLGLSTVNNLTQKLNINLKGSLDHYKAHDYFLWVNEIAKENKPTAQEVSQILSNIDNKNDLDKFTNLLRSYDRTEDDFWNSQNQPVRSLRELEKRVNFMKNKLDLKHVPEKYHSKMDVLVNAPGFDPAVFKSLSREERFVDLLEGKYPNWIEPKVQSYFPELERILTEVMSLRVPENFKELKQQKGKGDKKFDNKVSEMELNLAKQKAMYAKLKEIAIAEGLIKEGSRDFNHTLNIAIIDLLKKIPIKYHDKLTKECKTKSIDLGDEYIATIYDKSDPEGWVVGNWTDCCMPFGAENNTDYMYNSCTQYFSVKVKSKNGEERIIAQSVLVDGNNTDTNEDLIILDNIEVANSHKNKSDQLSYVYNRFWSENRNGKDIRIGAGYLDLIPSSATLVQNNSRPKNRLSYSDAGGPQIYNLPKLEDFGNKIEPVFANLTERDVEIISKLEAEIYSDNKGLQLGKGRVKEVIDAQREMQVPGAASSFVVRINNKPIGYLLVLPEKSEVNKGQIVAHVQDLAIKEEYRKGLLSLKMLNRVFDSVKAYNLPAIELDARESTSFKALRSPVVRRFIREKGFKLKFYDSSHNEVDYKNAEPNPNLEMGNENFYFVRIENELYDENRQVDFQQVNHNEVAGQYQEAYDDEQDTFEQ